MAGITFGAVPGSRCRRRNPSYWQCMHALTPFKLAPYFSPRIWGFDDLAPWFDVRTDGEPIGEAWLTGEKCVAANGPLAGRSLAQIMAMHGSDLVGAVYDGSADFPLLLKVIFPREKLSVQVHPDDALAQKVGGPRGKTECWYALEAEPDAKVAIGLAPGVTVEQVRAAVADNTLESLLGWVPIAAGDMVFVDAGTVHAIWPGAVIFEVQQQSDITYRLYDYGRPRELHIDESFAAMRLETRAGKVAPRREGPCTVLIDERYFRIERWPVADEAHARELSGAARTSAELLFVSEGALTLSGADFEPFRMGRCELAVIPANTPQWHLHGSAGAELMRVVPKA